MLPLHVSVQIILGGQFEVSARRPGPEKATISFECVLPTTVPVVANFLMLYELANVYSFAEQEEHVAFVSGSRKDA